MYRGVCPREVKDADLLSLNSSPCGFESESGQKSFIKEGLPADLRCFGSSTRVCKYSNICICWVNLHQSPHHLDGVTATGNPINKRHKDTVKSLMY